MPPPGGYTPLSSDPLPGLPSVAGGRSSAGGGPLGETGPAGVILGARGSGSRQGRAGPGADGCRGLALPATVRGTGRAGPEQGEAAGRAAAGSVRVKDRRTVRPLPRCLPGGAARAGGGGPRTVKSHHVICLTTASHEPPAARCRSAHRIFNFRSTRAPPPPTGRNTGPPPSTDHPPPATHQAPLPHHGPRPPRPHHARHPRHGRHEHRSHPEHPHTTFTANTTGGPRKPRAPAPDRTAPSWPPRGDAQRPGRPLEGTPRPGTPAPPRSRPPRVGRRPGPGGAGGTVSASGTGQRLATKTCEAVSVFNSAASPLEPTRTPPADSVTLTTEPGCTPPGAGCT